jgi:predicted transcriptional regulator
MLLARIERALIARGVDFHLTHNYIELNEERVLLKILGNIDSINKSGAEKMAKMAEDFSAAALIGLHDRTSSLENEIVYERYSFPAFTPKTLMDILDSEFPYLFRDRGGLFCWIDSQFLQAARKRAGMTQVQLAQRAKVSKKCIYEHERTVSRAKKDLAQKLSAILECDLSELCIPFRLVS